MPAKVVPDHKRKLKRELKHIQSKIKSEEDWIKAAKAELDQRQVSDIVKKMSVPFPRDALVSPIKSPRPKTSTPQKTSVKLYLPTPDVYRTTVEVGERTHVVANGRRAKEDKRYGYGPLGKLSKF